MDDFFSRVERRAHPWPAGRRDLHWLVIPGARWAKEHLCGPYRSIASAPGLHPVRPQWLHLTVLHSGPVGTAEQDEVDQLVAEVGRRAAGTDPFEVTLGRPAIGTVAVEVTGYPGAPWRALWEMTWQAQQQVVGDRWPLIPTSSYPHASLAYAGAEAHLADRGALKTMLSDLPGGPVPLPVTTLTLVSEWHDQQEIRWETLAEVPVGTGRPGA